MKQKIYKVLVIPHSMTIKNKVITVVVALAIGIGGYFGYSAINSAINNENLNLARQYQESEQRITGTVLNEEYKNTLSSVPEKHITGLVSQAYSNPTV